MLNANMDVLSYHPTPPPLWRATQVAPLKESPMQFCTAISAKYIKSKWKWKAKLYSRIIDIFQEFKKNAFKHLLFHSSNRQNSFDFVPRFIRLHCMLPVNSTFYKIKIVPSSPVITFHTQYEKRIVIMIKTDYRNISIFWGSLDAFLIFLNRLYYVAEYHETSHFDHTRYWKYPLRTIQNFKKKIYFALENKIFAM